MKQTSTGVSIVIAVTAVTLAFVLFSHRVAVEAVYPVERAALFFRRSVWPRILGVFDGPSLAAANARLRREVSSLSLLTGEVERLERENAALRRSLDYAAKVSADWLAAPVLTAHGGSASRGKVIRTGRGSADGVAENAIVVSPDGLVGVVTFVTEHTSEVTLITDRSLKVVCSVALGNGRTASGILEGGDGEALALTHIRGLSVDVPQASVMTSRRGGVFPAGLAVGSLIRSAPSEDGDWNGSVSPAVDFENLEDVFIRRER